MAETRTCVQTVEKVIQGQEISEQEVRDYLNSKQQVTPEPTSALIQARCEYFRAQEEQRQFVYGF